MTFLNFQNYDDILFLFLFIQEFKDRSVMMNFTISVCFTISSNVRLFSKENSLMSVVASSRIFTVDCVK